MRKRSRVVVALVLAGLVNGGCFTYAPIKFESVQPKDDVRLRVTEDAAARLSKELGAFSTEIDGELSPEGRDSVALGISIDRSYKGMTVGTSTQTLVLARSEVLEVRKRQFSKQRTVIVSVASVVGFGLLAAGVVQLLDPNGPDDSQTTNPPPPPGLRRPPPTHFGVRIPIP
jgi:hypothetical protein